MPDSLYFRRCHFCGKISHRLGEQVLRCDHCQKSLSRFYFYDDRLTTIYGDITLRPPVVNGEVRPIQGLTVYWDG